MNLGTFRSRIQQTTGVAGATSGHPEQGLVDGWVNEGVVQFLMRTKAVLKTASMALTVGQGDYNFDPTILAMEDLFIGGNMLDVVDSADIRKWRLGTYSQPAASSSPDSYAYEGQILMLYPTPSAAGTLNIIYVPRPTAMSGTNDDPSVSPFGEIPAEYHPVIEAYAKWKAGEYANDTASKAGQAWKAEYEEGIVKARIFETRKAGVNVRRAKPVGSRTGEVIVMPGVDYGN